MMTHVIHLLGVYLGEKEELMPPAPDNPEGFWERKDICALHERILEALHTAWDTSFPLPENWHLARQMAPFRDELVNLVSTNFARRELWAWKDPRMSILLPLWRDVLEELRIKFSCLLLTRNPLDVARSLADRDRFPREEALGIWFNYNLAMLRNSEGLPRALISYDRLLQDWEGTLSGCAKTLSLSRRRTSERARKAIAKVIRMDLRHSVSDLADLAKADCPAQVRELAGILDRMARTGNLDRPSDKLKLKRLLEVHARFAGLYRHDVARKDGAARELKSELSRLRELC